jgi:hypothetical protein
VKEITIAKSAKPMTMKQQIKLEKQREGLFFTPHTNMNHPEHIN